MIRDNPGGEVRGVSYVYPAGAGGPQWSDPGSVFKSDADPGGPDSYQGVSAIAGNPPWYDAQSEGARPYTSPFAQVWTRPDAWHLPTPTGTAAPGEETNPGQQPFIGDPGEETVDDEPTINDLGGKQRPPFSDRGAGTPNDDQYSTGGGVTGEGLIGDDPKISVSDVEEPDPGTEPEPGDLPTGDVRWGPDCRSVPGPFSRSKGLW